MGVNRDDWKAEFRKDTLLVWPCPACRISPLRLVPDTLRNGQTKASKADQNHPGWEPEWIDGRFSCMMDCSHCGNAVGAAGTFRVQDDRYMDPIEGESGDYEEHYKVKYFTESPHLFEIPESTPEPVREELIASFQLFWSDPLACTNRIRSSVEKLLTAQGVHQTTGRTASKGKRQFLTLHRRIELYAEEQPRLAASLMATKWIGNAGSHAKPITVEDALDGYELMDGVLHDLYAKRQHRVPVLTREINRRRAPRSPRRRSAGG
jgi:hypothetical protein